MGAVEQHGGTGRPGAGGDSRIVFDVWISTIIGCNPAMPRRLVARAGIGASSINVSRQAAEISDHAHTPSAGLDLLLVLVSKAG